MAVRTVLTALTALAAVLAAAGCDQAPEASPLRPPAAPSTSASSGPAPPPATSAAPAPSSEPPVVEPVTIAVAGDVHFEGALRDRLRDPEIALAPATRTLASADLAVVNLETSVGEGGAPEPGKRYTFQAPATAFDALAAAGVDVATMANNHALDFGRAALPTTFAAIDAAPLAVVGLGRDADEAFRPALVDVRGTVVATLGTTTAATDPTADPTGDWAATATSPGTADAVDPRRLLRAVRAADRAADVVVVHVHWGVQGQACPVPRQRSLARALVRSGADVVVGSHAHRLQGAGRLGAGYVAYGLGNYAWYTPTELTGVLTLTVQPPAERTGRARVTAEDWEPARIGADGLPTPLTGAAAAGFADALASLRGCAGLSAAS